MKKICCAPVLFQKDPRTGLLFSWTPALRESSCALLLCFVGYLVLSTSLRAQNLEANAFGGDEYDAGARNSIFAGLLREPSISLPALASPGGKLLNSSADSNSMNPGRAGEYDVNTGSVLKIGLITGRFRGRGLAFEEPVANSHARSEVPSVPEPPIWSMIAVGSVAWVGIMLRRRGLSPARRRW